MATTIIEKIWKEHELAVDDDGRSLIYIDRHLTHEVTSPVAFEDLRIRGRKLRRPDLTVAVMDHNVPTGPREEPIRDELSYKQMQALYKNSEDFGTMLLDYYSPFQGIIHIIGPELGLTLPGMTLAAGDSHTSTHGALGALAFGIGTSEVEHVFATQTLWLKKPKTMEIKVSGSFGRGVYSKDLALFLIGQLGTGGGIGHILEYTGETIRSMTPDERMTLCNLSTEAGARSSIISPDDKIFNYVRGRAFAPEEDDFNEAVEYWKTLASDPNATYDKSYSFDVSGLKPMVTWGTNPSMVVPVTGSIPSPDQFEASRRPSIEAALKYMGLTPGQVITDIKVDRVFIGSCTNSRLSDLTIAARVVKGRKVSKSVRAMVVPGSQYVKRNAERKGLHSIFLEAGFEWRNAGCSMCIGMNEDQLLPSERAASTTNRNFENRQGPGGRTHLVSPAMAAAAAVEGHFVDITQWDMPEAI